MMSSVYHYSAYFKRAAFIGLIGYPIAPIAPFIVDPPSFPLNFEGKLIIVFILISELLIYLYMLKKVYSFEISNSGIIKKYPLKFGKVEKIPISDVIVAEYFISKHEGLSHYVFFYDEKKCLGMVTVSSLKDTNSTLLTLNKLEIPLFMRRHPKEKTLLYKKSWIEETGIIFDEENTEMYEKKYTEYAVIGKFTLMFD